MEKELFIKTYTPALAKFTARFVEKEAREIADIILGDNYHLMLKAKHRIEDLSMAKAIIQEYPGCPYCFEMDCTSDHK